MKSKLKKLLIIILIILSLNNFFMTPIFANDEPTYGEAAAGLLESIFGSIIGLFTFPIRLIALGAAYAVNILTANVAYIEGTTSTAGSTNTTIITPFDIFFNKVKILDVNFFDIDNDGSLVSQIRTNVAIWYYVLRNIATIILLVVLIYVGIRMAISTIATDKAMYKKMLIDWVASLALVFIMEYIIVLVVNINDTIVKGIEFGVNSESIANTYGVLRDLSLEVFELDSVAATVIFCMLVWQTLGLVISYFNRMLKAAFLIIISPLITLTYSIDKMGDGKAQALGTWLREFIFTIVIQPFHCIIYMCFIDIAFKLIINNTQGTTDNSILAVSVISILCVRFVKEAENLVRKILGFSDDNQSMGTSIGAGTAIAGAALVKSNSIGKSARGMINGVKGTKGALSASLNGAKVGIMARGMKIADRIQHKNRNKTIDEYKADARTNITEKRAEKIEKKYSLKKDSDAVMKEMAKLPLDKMSEQEKRAAKAAARLNVAREVRSHKGWRKPITAVRGTVNKVRNTIDNNKVLKGLGSMTKATISAGMGLMTASGMYGTGSKLSESVMGGVAMFNGTQAFQTTAATIEKGIKENLEGEGATDQLTGGIVGSEIMSNADLYEPGDTATNQMKQLMDDLGNALMALGFSKNERNSIRNIVERGIKANPKAMPNIINNALSKYKNSSNNLNQSQYNKQNMQNLENATKNLASYLNRKEIYNKVKQAGEFNLTPDQVLGGAISRMQNVSSNAEEATTSLIDQTVQVGNTSDVNEYDKLKDEIAEKLKREPLNVAEIKSLENELERIIDQKRKEIEEFKKNMPNSQTGLVSMIIQADEQEVENLEREQAETIANAIINCKDEVEVEMKNKYKTMLSDEINKANLNISQNSTPILNKQLQHLNQTLNDLNNI